MQIAYYEQAVPEAPIIVFLHGNSDSSAGWKKQFESDLLAKYHLIALDLPAHGNTDASPTHSYGLSDMGKVMTEAVETLTKGKPFVLIGFSLGTNLVMEMCQWLKPTGVVLVGSTIFGSSIMPDQVGQPQVDVSPLFSDNASLQAVTSYARLLTASENDDVVEHFVNSYKQVKVGFRMNFFMGIVQGKFSDQIALLRSQKNTLMIFGEKEGIVRPDYLDALVDGYYQKKVYRIPNAGHFAHMDQPQVFNALIAEYLSDTLTV